MKKKRLMILIIICLIILIGLIICVKYINSKKQVEQKISDEQLQNQKEMEEDIKEYFSDKICPKGLATLYSNYYGANDMNDLYRGLYTLVDYLPKLFEGIQDLNNSQLNQYYNSNERIIRKTFGINDFETFEEFVKYLKSTGYTFQDIYIYCQVDVESYTEDNDYLMFNISFSFEGKENLITLKTYFSNKLKTTYSKPELKFEPVI